MANNVTININAGTARYNRQLDQAKAKMRETFGHGSVSSIQATSASLRLLEGNMTNNIRAVERFLANTLKLGPVLQAAFPVIGAAALGTFLLSLTEKAHKFFTELQNAPEKIRGVFGDLNATLQVTNDSLAVSNARLENELQTLSGHPSNNLKVALLEAVEAADKLNESLEKDIKSAHTLVDEQSGGWMKRLISSMSLPGFVGKADLKDIALELGGETGEGGFRSRIRGLNGADLAKAYTDEIAKFQQQIKNAEHSGQYGTSDFLGNVVTGNMTARLEILKSELSGLQKNLEQISLTEKNSDLKKKVAGQEDKNQREALERPFDKKIAELDARFAGIQGKLAAIGKDSTFQAMSEGAAQAARDTAEVTEALKRRHEQMTVGQAMDILTKDVRNAMSEAELKWKQKLEETNDALDERIAQQKKLNALNESDYAAKRDIATEATLKGTFRSEYGDPDKAVDIEKVRQKLTQEADLEHERQLKLQSSELDAQVTLYSRLAQVAGDFSKTHQAQLDAEITKMRAEGKYTEEQIEKVRILNGLKLEAESAARAAADRLSTANIQRATAAAFGGLDVRQQAEIQNRLDEAESRGATAAERKALQAKLEAEYQEKIISEAGALSTAWSDQAEILDKQIAAIKAQIVLHGQDLELQHALHDLEDKRKDIAIEMKLEQGSALDGVRAFFIEMQKQAEDASKMIYRSLNEALERTSDNFAKMMTTKAPKGGWGKMWGETFTGIGQELSGAAIHSGLQRGLGALGNLFGIKMPAGKPDGTSSNPLHVIVQGSNVAGGNAVPNPLGGLLKKGGRVFGGDQGGFIFNALPGFAMGGNASGWGMAGERGPELVNFGGGARVYSHDETNKMLGGTHYHINYDIDARGAEIGVEGRIAQAISTAHDSAVQTAIRANDEIKARMPQKVGGRA